VRQDAHGISLSQKAYAVKIVEKCGLQDCNSSATPMEPRLKLSRQSLELAVDKTLYRSLVGSLRYLVNTWPAIIFVVGYVSRFLEEPCEDHMVAVKRIVRYVACTCDLGLWYIRGKEKEAMLIGISDNDYAGDADQRYNTTGVIFLLVDSPVSWQSMRQKVVAQSSCEAKYITTANATCQGLWLARVLGEVQSKLQSRPMLKVDNKSAIALIKNPVLSQQSKHIEVKYHLVCGSAARGQITMEFIGTENQLGDIFTKALGRIGFQELCNRIGLIQVK
jgi:hypothetical protein